MSTWQYDEWKELTGIVKAGCVLIFSNGSYSDYSFSGAYVAIKDFNYVEEAKKCYFEFLEERFSKLEDKSYFEQPSFELFYDNIFESYLIRNGFIINVDTQTIHQGDYDFFGEDEWFKEFIKLKGVNRG